MIDVLRSRHELLGKRLDEAPDPGSPPDPPSRSVVEAAREALAGLEERRMSGSVAAVGTTRKVFEGVDLVSGTDFDQAVFIKDVTRKIEEAGA